MQFFNSAYLLWFLLTLHSTLIRTVRVKTARNCRALYFGMGMVVCKSINSVLKLANLDLFPFLFTLIQKQISFSSMNVNGRPPNGFSRVQGYQLTRSAYSHGVMTRVQYKVAVSYTDHTVFSLLELLFHQECEKYRIPIVRSCNLGFNAVFCLDGEQRLSAGNPPVLQHLLPSGHEV